MIADQITLAAASSRLHLFARFTGAVARVRLNWARRRAIDELSILPPYLLYDIGVTAADIDTARQTGRHSLPRSLRC